MYTFDGVYFRLPVATKIKRLRTRIRKIMAGSEWDDRSLSRLKSLVAECDRLLDLPEPSGDDYKRALKRLRKFFDSPND